MSRFQRLMRDRRALGIAAIAGAVLLLVIAGVLAVSLLSDQPEIGGASETPSPSMSPEPTDSDSPQPSPSEPAPSPTPVPPPMALDQPFAATVQVNGLNVRETPGDGAPLSSLDAGEVVLINGEHQEVDGIAWYPVMATGTEQPTYGWVSAGPDNDPYLELHFQFASMVPARVEGMSGSDAGYLAWGFHARETTEQPTRFVAVSAVGSSWELTDAPGSTGLYSSVLAAHGPSGWLLVTSNDDNTGPGELWRSDDGLTWQLGDLSLPDQVVPERLVGFADGYALAARDDRSGTSTGALFTSPDGSQWQQTGDDLPNSLGLDALDNGFIATGDTGESFTLRTGNAEGWTSVEASLPGYGPRVVSIGDSVIAVATGPALGPVQAWRSSLDLDAWERVPELEAILGDIGISYLVADDESILLAGQEYSDGAEQWWRSSDGIGWERISPTGASLADLSGPMTAGAGGFSAAAFERTAAGPNPRFVVSADALAWTAATESALPIVDSAVVGSCPTAPDTMLEWMAIPGTVGAECFGSSPVTFTAYLTMSGGCGGLIPGRFEPAWLAHPFAEWDLVVAPMEVPYGSSCGNSATAPGTDIPDQHQWVTVTGHWADPAAAQCRWIPQHDYAPWGGYRGDLVSDCQRKFVATSVTPTSAP